MSEFELAVLEKLERLTVANEQAVVEMKRMNEQHQRNWDDQQIAVVQHTMPRKMAKDLNWLTAPTTWAAVPRKDDSPQTEP